jgi:hypothetical protein
VLRYVCLAVIADIGKIVLFTLKTQKDAPLRNCAACQGSWLVLLGKTRTVSDFTYRLLGQAQGTIVGFIRYSSNLSIIN